MPFRYDLIKHEVFFQNFIVNLSIIYYIVFGLTLYAKHQFYYGAIVVEFHQDGLLAWLVTINAILFNPSSFIGFEQTIKDFCVFPFICTTFATFPIIHLSIVLGSTLFKYYILYLQNMSLNKKIHSHNIINYDKDS